MLQVKDVVKFYGEHEALHNVSFHVKQGQIVGLLGKNGAGKSTTMNIITGYLAATSGEILIDGMDIVSKPKEAKKRLGYLPEHPPLYEKMTVKEYLEFVAELKGFKHQKKEEALAVMEKTNLSEREDMLILNLSKGYKQRVGLAQALIGNPPLIILDEPMVGLDPNQIIETRQLIRSLRGEHSVILSSHILSEVESICDRIIILKEGSVAAENDTKKLEEENSAQTRIRVVIKGSKAEIAASARESDLLKDFSLVREVEKGVYEYRAIASKDHDIRDELFLLFAEKKLVIYSLDFEKVSLEDVFLKVTGKEEDA